MAWSRGEPWRVAESLQTLNAQIRTTFPRAVPPATPVTSWGSVADSAHSTTSDHSPHYYEPLGAVATVLARDFPHAPELGLDAHKLAEVLRKSRDKRIGYIISNGRVTGPGHDWRWDTYHGSDPHDTHIHVSVVHSKAADDRTPWQIGGNDVGTLEGVQGQALADMRYTLTNIPAVDGKSRVPLHVWANQLVTLVKAVAAGSVSDADLAAMQAAIAQAAQSAALSGAQAGVVAAGSAFADAVVARIEAAGASLTVDTVRQAVQDELAEAATKQAAALGDAQS